MGGAAPSSDDAASSDAAVLKAVGQVPGAAGPLERRTVVLLAVAVAAVAAAIAASALPNTPEERAGKAVALVSALVGFVFTYLQWRAARHEASFERYYDRLDVANRKLDAAVLEDTKGANPAGATHLWLMFHYAELDNLEYILGKYRLRYVRADLAARGVRHFRQRCRNKDFRAEVCRIADSGEGAYEASTRAAVLQIAAS